MSILTILLVASIFGFVLSTLLLLKRSVHTQATFFLGSFYVILSVYVLQTYIVEGGYLDKAPWFFIWPLIPYNALCIPIYFYFQTIFKDRLEWKKRHLLLFVPMMLAVVDVGYIYSQPSADYDMLINETIKHPELRLNADYLLLDLNQHLLLRHLWQLGVILVILPQLIKFVKLGREDQLKKTLNTWLSVFWGILFIMAVAVVLYAFEKMMGTRLLYAWIGSEQQVGLVTLILYLAVLLLEIVPLYFPSILHGYPQTAKFTSSVQNIPEEEISELKFGLEEQDILTKLDLIKQQKLYLYKEFNLTQCAQEMKMPAHHISYFLKSYFGVTFNAYKNKLRMDYAKNQIENGFLKNGTIESLAGDCGFASRSSFSKAFKNETGVSPSQYGAYFK